MKELKQYLGEALRSKTSKTGNQTTFYHGRKRVAHYDNPYMFIHLDETHGNTLYVEASFKVPSHLDPHHVASSMHAFYKARNYKPLLSTVYRPEDDKVYFIHDDSGDIIATGHDSVSMDYKEDRMRKYGLIPVRDSNGVNLEKTLFNHVMNAHTLKEDGEVVASNNNVQIDRTVPPESMGKPSFKKKKKQLDESPRMRVIGGRIEDHQDGTVMARFPNMTDSGLPNMAGGGHYVAVHEQILSKYGLEFSSEDNTVDEIGEHSMLKKVPESRAAEFAEKYHDFYKPRGYAPLLNNLGSHVADNDTGNIVARASKGKIVCQETGKEHPHVASFMDDYIKRKIGWE